MTQQFNDLCNWVTWEVCRQFKMKQRVEVIKKFIKVARYCLACNNLDSMFAIISGLGAGPVARLKQSWARLPAKFADAFHDLEGYMDPSRNMSHYRSLLQAFVE